jgi:hypothetical protein
MITRIELGIAHRSGCFRAPKETPSATTRGSLSTQCSGTHNKRHPHFEKPRRRLNPTTHKSRYLRKGISARTEEVFRLPLHLSQKSKLVGNDGGFIRSHCRHARIRTMVTPKSPSCPQNLLKRVHPRPNINNNCVNPKLNAAREPSITAEHARILPSQKI